ncbi:MAG: LacI family DNA-binding transcriptional regulator [Candidatus Krumholzibacteria bacterium]|nr:LacI family DNA-binding transcriptional regulator [Candidatus Krumholzibacteria bacterium]
MANIRDVARAAGVSIATVSRVFNNLELVNGETARRVLQAAAACDYWPNEAAKSLTTNRCNAFGVLLPDLYGEFYSEIIRGIDQRARQARYQILLSSSHANNDDVFNAARAMLGRVDGLILMTPDTVSPDVVERVRKRLPIVLLNPSFAADGCGSVAIDNYGGAYAATSHLLQLGHRDIAMIAGPAGNVDADERRRGFQTALREFGLDPARAETEVGDFREAAGHAAGLTILARRPQPTAVFAANDSMAIGLLGATREQGLRVPDDLAVVGFDDITIARYLNPPLTTVTVDIFGLGRKAVAMMLATVEAADAHSPDREVLPAVLTVRESCGAKRRVGLTQSPR